MERVTQLGYIGLAVQDLDHWRQFGTEILGFHCDTGEDGTLRFRMDDYQQRIIVQPNGNDDVAFLGWEISDQRGFESMISQLHSAGVGVEAGTPGQAKARGVAGLVSFTDPNGIACELYYGAKIVNQNPFHSPRAISGFITGEMGVGHAVLVVDDPAETLSFYRDVLGLRESDFITFSRGEHELSMTFMHCNPRHHSLAFMAAPMPKRLHHLMFEVASLDDVGNTYTLCGERDVAIASTLGRHTNDEMVSFYMQSPSGFEIEYGWGGKLVDDSTWKVQTYGAPSIWGHDRGQSGARRR